MFHELSHHQDKIGNDFSDIYHKRLLISFQKYYFVLITFIEILIHWFAINNQIKTPRLT